MAELNQEVRPEEDAPSFDEQVKAGLDILRGMLETLDGKVSIVGFKREMRSKGVREVEKVVTRIKFHDFDEDDDEMRPLLPDVNFRCYRRDRSFYSKEKFQELENKISEDAKETSEDVAVDEDIQETSPSRRKVNRQEEAYLVGYVYNELADIYSSDFGSESDPISFDVHNMRPGSEYENVDVLAVHWISESIVESVTVEVKLEFTSRLVQQANNYRRFSHRVWIAVPIEGKLNEAASFLRQTNLALYEYVVELGIGILACRKGQGDKYTVQAVHWPSLNHPSRLEFDQFIGRHIDTFRDARCLRVWGIDTRFSN